MNIDYEGLRSELKHFTLGARFGGKIGATELYYDRIVKADEEELLQIARECNFPIEDFIIHEHKGNNSRR